MSEVMVVFRILPTDRDVDLSKVEAEARRMVNVKRVEREPIAFGLEALKLTVFMMDAEGESDRIEEKIRSINGVGGLEILETSRLM